MNNYLEFSKPINILLKTINIIKWLFFFIIILIVASFYVIFIELLSDFQQGINYLNLYIHVPSAWMAMIIYIIISITSAIYIINRNPIINIFTIGGLFFGCIFTFITLITGIFWGKPMWGTYWVWDARLTSVLILFIIYLINILIHISNNNSDNMISSIIILIGLINIPIIKASVEWWSTLHQPSSIYQLNSSIHISMLIPLIYMTIAFLLIYLTYLIIYIRSQINKKRAIHIDITNKYNK